MAKRSFLMLAHKYEPTKHKVDRWYVSEKLDGMRAFWDGGITRGKLSKDVAFANVEKDGRYVKSIVSTGLWSRYGKTIQAPGWWLDKLPRIPLDGELYFNPLNTARGDDGQPIRDRDAAANYIFGTSYAKLQMESGFPQMDGVIPKLEIESGFPGVVPTLGGFQRLVSITKQLTPVDSDWEKVNYMVFDSPAPYIIYGNGKIDETNIKKEFIDVERKLGIAGNFTPARTFADSYSYLQQFPQNSVYCVHRQLRLSDIRDLDEVLKEVTDRGGEGLMLRDGNSIWVPQRSHSLLKVKGMQDAEATVVGYVWGRETDKGSKLLGMMGAMIVKLDNGIVFELSGFTDAEREMAIPIYNEPGQRVPDHIESKVFQRGEKVTFKFRELTRDGVPKEARYYRKYNV